MYYYCYFCYREKKVEDVHGQFRKNNLEKEHIFLILLKKNRDTSHDSEVVAKYDWKRMRMLNSLHVDTVSHFTVVASLFSQYGIWLGGEILTVFND